MKKHGVVALMVVALAFALATLPASAKDKSGDAGRLLTGRVVNKRTLPFPIRWFISPIPALAR